PTPTLLPYTTLFRSIDSDPKSAWAINPQFGKDHAATFELAAPVGFDGGTILIFTLKFNNNDGHNIGRLRLSVSGAAKTPEMTAPDRKSTRLNSSHVK